MIKRNYFICNNEKCLAITSHVDRWSPGSSQEGWGQVQLSVESDLFVWIVKIYKIKPFFKNEAPCRPMGSRPRLNRPFLNEGATPPWARACGRSPAVTRQGPRLNWHQQVGRGTWLNGDQSESSSSEICILKMVTLGGGRPPLRRDSPSEWDSRVGYTSGGYILGMSQKW